ncbi:MAG: hypothetical protein WCW66_04390 [Patescibacteria group bacterium]
MSYLHCLSDAGTIFALEHPFVKEPTDIIRRPLLCLEARYSHSCLAVDYLLIQIAIYVNGAGGVVTDPHSPPAGGYGGQVSPIIALRHATSLGLQQSGFLQN